MNRTWLLIAVFLIPLLALVLLGVFSGSPGSQAAVTSPAEVARALEGSAGSTVRRSRSLIAPETNGLDSADSEAQLEPSIIPEPSVSVVPPFESMSREALIGMQAILSDRFARDKNAALYLQWVGGIVHDVPLRVGQLSGRLGHSLEDTENPIVRQYRMHHDGVTSRCEEVRLEPEAYPEIYQMRDDLNHIKAALKLHGYDPVLSTIFPAIGSEFKGTVFGAD